MAEGTKNSRPNRIPSQRARSLGSVLARSEREGSRISRENSERKKRAEKKREREKGGEGGEPRLSTFYLLRSPLTTSLSEV